jgi:RNA polymerase-binding transcription factor DksA
MKPDELNRYRERLMESLSRVQHDAALVSEKTFETGGASPMVLPEAPTHADDMSSESYLRELNATLLAHEEHLAKEALAALRRIDEGTYGRCEGCGQAIHKARLDAIPFTRFCTPCAEARPATVQQKGD